MGAMYGKKPLHLLEQKGGFTLSNGMYCVFGKNDEGVCVDVYRDKTRRILVSMQHGITTGNTKNELDPTLLKKLMESMVNEF